MLPESEYKEVENRKYINPNLVVDETSSFIDNLRQTQAAQNAQVAEQTRMLGTDVPTSLGGLAGSNASSYWTSRYQTPTTNALVQGLRTAARASALNQALQNEQEMWKNRYQQAYRNYQRRQYAKANTPQNPYVNIPGDEPEKETTTPAGTSETSLSGKAGAYTVVDIAGNLHIVDMETGEEKVLSPDQSSQTRSPVVDGGGEIKTLPNGNKVWVRPGYNLTKDGEKYYLINQSTGVRTEVGGY